MLVMFIWYLCGLVGNLFIYYCGQHDTKKRDITFGCLISFIFTPVLGPVVLLMVIAAYFCGDDRPKWESKILWKSKS